MKQAGVVSWEISSSVHFVVMNLSVRWSWKQEPDSKKLSPKKEIDLEKLPPIGEHRPISHNPQAAIDAGNLNRLEEAIYRSVLPFRSGYGDYRCTRSPKCYSAIIDRMTNSREGCIGSLPNLYRRTKSRPHLLICGAATFSAKVDRDQKIKSLGPVGSGYPS